ncbi:MAG: superoxide dismutase [Alphaproteobacteria bacterium]|nr:superoxide dismutase [Alphaproteobacteria bacterium]
MTAFNLPKLPFAYDALNPYMSAETFEFHHDKHHNAYVENSNKIIKDLDHMGDTLEEVIINALKQGETSLFNNTAQHWNHSFFWNCLKPNSNGNALPSALKTKIDIDLGGYDKFKAKFIESCVTQFGSGWGWLTIDNKTSKLEITKTSNAGVPFTEGKTPLLTCDVWEHAYYIDYRNDRPKYVETFIDKMVNWEFVESMLEK